MSLVKPAPRPRMLVADWMPRHHVLAYFLSLLAHATFLLLFAATMRWFDRGPVGFSDEPMREIGIFVEQGDRPDAPENGNPGDGEVAEAATEVNSAVEPMAPTQVTSDTPPAPTTLPTADALPQIGVGQGIEFPTEAVGNPRSPIKSQGGTRPAGTGVKGGIPGAAFMGTRDENGMKVVFVIDASGSMDSYNAMQVAKGALLSSLQALDERQQFLLIFYDEKPHVIRLHDEAKPTLVAATELNKTLARQKISGIRPGSGTDHLPPLKMALQMHPDVIFFLTDALDPPLWPQDLEQIRSLNAGRVRIHSIEFGQGPELESDSDLGNFLRKLARQNGGTYRYHDVTRFKAP